MNDTRRLAYLLIALLILASCINKQPGNLILEPSETKPDTAKPEIISSYKSMAYPAIFEAAFNDSTKVSEGNMLFTFYKYDVGKIIIESGEIIACDPIVMHDASPFSRVFPKGEFAVHLAMAKTHNDERVAFSRIVFSETPVFKWEVALQNGQQPISLKDSTMYCYGVDAGTGLFIDSVANKFFNQYDRWEEVFVKKAEQNGYRGYIQNFGEHNLATFSTGYGDGCYATFIGLDEKGNPCQLLTDFGLVGWWKLPEK